MDCRSGVEKTVFTFLKLYYFYEMNWTKIPKFDVEGNKAIIWFKSWLVEKQAQVQQLLLIQKETALELLQLQLCVQYMKSCWYMPKDNVKVKIPDVYVLHWIPDARNITDEYTNQNIYHKIQEVMRNYNLSFSDLAFVLRFNVLWLNAWWSSSDEPCINLLEISDMIFLPTSLLFEDIIGRDWPFTEQLFKSGLSRDEVEFKKSIIRKEAEEKKILFAQYNVSYWLTKLKQFANMNILPPENIMIKNINLLYKIRNQLWGSNWN